MLKFSPDPVSIEVLSQGAGQPCRVRLELPDGSGGSGTLDPAGLTTQAGSLQEKPGADAAQALGELLYQSLLPGSLAGAFQGAVTAAGERGIRLRLHLDETVPALQRIPWERLYRPEGDNWVPAAPAAGLYFSRFLQNDQPWGLPLPAGPLKALVLISSPFPPGNSLYVDVNQEQQSIQEVFGRFSGQIEYDVLSGAVTAQQLADRLNQEGGFDILYYVGHGDWKESEQTGYLLMSGTYPDGSQGPVGVSSAELVKLFGTVPRLPELIFLAACESGQQSSQDAFAGVGPQLVRAGCPALVCMQARVENQVARQFACQMFASLLETGCVDLAVNRARAGLLEQAGGQWAVPVLYMHLPDGILFNPEQRFKPAQRLPYKFLAPYQCEDQDLFNGRKKVIAEIRQHLNDYPLTLVFGEAGVGLTSLVEAGLRPVLEQENWLVVSIAAYADLAQEFRLGYRVAGHPVNPGVGGDAPLAEVLRTVNFSQFAALALILDQFEQVTGLEGKHQQAMLAELNAALEALGERLKLVFAIHKDALANLGDLQAWLANRSGNWIEVEPLGLDEAVEAIVDPLDTLGWPVTLNPTLARELIAPDLANLYTDSSAEDTAAWVDPGQLQITCTWLYQHARELHPPLIDENLYLKQAGGADGILVRYMKDELETHFADQSGLAGQILVAMAAPEMDHWAAPEQILASPALNGFKDGQGPALAPPAVEQILERLVKAELLVRRLNQGCYRYAFPNQMIADEAIRLGGEQVQQAYNAGDELERAWRIWLAEIAQAARGSKTGDRALAGRAQLRKLEEYGAHLDPRPVKVLFLLRSAVARDVPAGPWLDRLQALESSLGFIRAIELGGMVAGVNPLKGSARELAGRLLGLNDPDLPKRPEQEGGYGDLAWAAAAGRDTIGRRTAALALMALQEGQREAFYRLEHALADLDTSGRRFIRRAELAGALADAGQAVAEIKKASVLQRLAVYGWRAGRRILRNGCQITWIAAGTGIGAGLALGFERLVVGWLSQSQLGTIFFALFSYWGLLLAGVTALTAGMARSLRLDRQSQPGRPQRNGLVFVLGWLGFGLANLVVALLNGISISKAPAVLPLGFLAGAGFSAALYLGRGDSPLGRLARGLAGAVTFGLVEALFLAWPALGSGIAIALSGSFFASEFDHFTAGWWQTWMAHFAGWNQVLALIEAGLCGLALTLGALAGRGVAQRWYTRWSRFIESGED